MFGFILIILKKLNIFYSCWGIFESIRDLNVKYETEIKVKTILARSGINSKKHFFKNKTNIDKQWAYFKKYYFINIVIF